MSKKVLVTKLCVCVCVCVCVCACVCERERERERERECVCEHTYCVLEHLEKDPAIGYNVGTYETSSFTFFSKPPNATL